MSKSVGLPRPRNVTTPSEWTSEDPITGDLLAWIQEAVKRIAASARDLTEAQVRTPVAASGWTILGLANHVRDSSTFWLGNVIAGVPIAIEDQPWDNDPRTPAREVIADLVGSVERSCAAVRRVRHDATPGWWPDGAWGGYRQTTVRGVLLHLLNDNAAHAGHMDIVRERIDGAVWNFSHDALRAPGGGLSVG